MTSKLNYSKEQINKIIEDSGLAKVAMAGVYNDLTELKPLSKIFMISIFFI